ncbi:hypothetical protein BB560_001389 [Smittium megazygosporum]|uniref:UDENN domain-containing protein n=1 Tax=Smittium megazygosporum TaxID=133381 RepID=A0A2T9ZHT2_9FUNG|nr:hypothetical protein BB560_001389 [Smittium megazygosporum]
MTNLIQIEYILLAEFDINEGSILRHQYPTPTFEDESGSIPLPREGINTQINSPSTINPILVLIYSILTEKKIIFMGHNQPAEEVSNFVLSALVIGSGGGSVLKALKYKIFPYASLASIDRLSKLNSYIAGVTNPIFEEKKSLWDLLFNINTGEVKVHPSLLKSFGFHNIPVKNEINLQLNSESSSILLSRQKKDPKAEKSTTYDQRFLQELFSAVESRAEEHILRAICERFIRKFIFLCAIYQHMNLDRYDLFLAPRTVENDNINIAKIKDSLPSKFLEYVYSTKLETLKSVQRPNNYSFRENTDANHSQSIIIAFLKTNLYSRYAKDLKQARGHFPVNNIDLYSIVERLTETIPNIDESITIYTLMFHSIVTEDQVTMLLAYLTFFTGGIDPIVSGLYHKDDRVKYYATFLLYRIELHIAGKKFIDSLNGFHKQTFKFLRDRFSV